MSPKKAQKNKPALAFKTGFEGKKPSGLLKRLSCTKRPELCFLKAGLYERPEIFFSLKVGPFF